MWEWILSMLGGGSLGSLITYLLTIRSKTKMVKEESKQTEIKTQHDQLDFNQDMCDYLQKMTDKYIHDYHELEANFRKKVSELQVCIDALQEEKSKIISAKCNEILQLRAQITYLEEASCYDFTCQKRKNNKK